MMPPVCSVPIRRLSRACMEHAPRVHGTCFVRVWNNRLIPNVKIRVKKRAPFQAERQVAGVSVHEMKKMLKLVINVEKIWMFETESLPLEQLCSNSKTDNAYEKNVGNLWRMLVDAAGRRGRPAACTIV